MTSLIDEQPAAAHAPEQAARGVLRPLPASRVPDSSAPSLRDRARDDGVGTGERLHGLRFRESRPGNE